MLSAFLKEIEQERARRRTENALAYYRPYAKQREFHAAGAGARERLLMAGNQLGKTLAGGLEAAKHATGRYPDWRQGRRFDKPTIAWVAGVTGESTRDNPQRSPSCFKIVFRRPGPMFRETLSQLIASRPFALTIDKSFSDGPLGRFWPRSHSPTSFGLTLR